MMSEQGDLVVSRATHNFGIFRKSGKRAIFQIDFLSSKIKIIQRGSVKYTYDFDQLIQYDSEEGLTISVKLGHKDLEFDAGNTEEKLTICSLLGIVKGGEVTSQQVQQAEKQEAEDHPSSIRRRPASVIKEGVLEKKGHAAIQVWSKRRVKISPGELSYFKPDEEIALNIVQLSADKYMMKPVGNNGFVLIVSDRKYHFRIPTELKNINIEQTRDDWIYAFNQACCQRRKTVLLLEQGMPNVGQRDMQPSSDLFTLPRRCSDPDFNSGTGITPARSIHLSQTSIEEEPESNQRLSQIVQRTELLENVTKHRPKKMSSKGSRKLSEQQSTDDLNQHDQLEEQSEESSDTSSKSEGNNSNNRGSQRSTNSSGKSVVSIDNEFQETIDTSNQSDSVRNMSSPPLTSTECDQCQTATQILKDNVHKEWLSPEDEPDKYEDDVIYENIQACRAQKEVFQLPYPKVDNTNNDASINDGSENHIADDSVQETQSESGKKNDIRISQIRQNDTEKEHMETGNNDNKDQVRVSINQNKEIEDDHKCSTFEQIREKFNVTDTEQGMKLPNQQEQNEITNVPEAPPPPPSLPPPPPPIHQQGERKYRTLHWTPVHKSQIKGSVWKNTKDVTTKLDENLLQENFSIQKHNAMKFTGDQDEKKVLLDSRRARNLAIILNGLKSDKACSIYDILNSVKEDDSFPAEKLTTIRRYQPTSDDIEVYKLYADRKEMLDPVDQFMYELCEIQCLSLRLDFVLLLWDFPRQLKCSTQAVEKIMAACDQLMSSQQLVGVLSYILAIGNYLSSKNNDEKGCIGFKLSSLGKFIEMRGRSADCTFLHVLAEQVKVDSDLQGWTEKLSCVHDCEGLSVPAVSTEIEVLRCDLTTLKKNLKVLKGKLKKPSDKEKEFFNTAQAMLLEMEATVNKLDKMGSQVQTKYRRTLEYFGESTSVSSTEFFGAISEFVRKYDLAVQDNASRKRKNERQ